MAESIQQIHPRELELATRLKGIEFPWEPLTGDWFVADGGLHIVMQIEPRGEETLLQGRGGNCYEKSKVVWVPHRTTCEEWLHANDWEINVDLSGGKEPVGVATRRKTGYRVEKKEPTELAVLLALVLEIQEQIYFGWA